MVCSPSELSHVFAQCSAIQLMTHHCSCARILTLVLIRFIILMISILACCLVSSFSDCPAVIALSLWKQYFSKVLSQPSSHHFVGLYFVSSALICHPKLSSSASASLFFRHFALIQHFHLHLTTSHPPHLDSVVATVSFPPCAPRQRHLVRIGRASFLTVFFRTKLRIILASLDTLS